MSNSMIWGYVFLHKRATDLVFSLWETSFCHKMMNIPRTTLQFTHLLKSNIYTKALSTCKSKLFDYSLSGDIILIHIFFVVVGSCNRSYSTEAPQATESPSKSANGPTQSTSVPSNSRFVYPEFLPDPEPKYRNPIKEKLERLDMLSRR